MLDVAPPSNSNHRNATVSNSCLALPSFKKLKKKRQPGSQAALKSYQQQQQQHQRSISSKDGSFPQLYEPSASIAKQQQEQKQQHDDSSPLKASSPSATAVLVTPEQPPRIKQVEHLLTPPEPVDRASSVRQRKLYEQSQRRRGLYDGEMEPQGMRGDEATSPPVIQQSPPSFSVSPQMRSFQANDHNKSPAISIQPITATAVPVHEDSRPQSLPARTSQRTSSSNSSRSSQKRNSGRSNSTTTTTHTKTSSNSGRRYSSASSSSDSSSNYHNKEPQKLLQLSAEGRAVRLNPINGAIIEESDGESTESDEDIKYMLPDLLPSNSNDKVPSTNPRDTGNGTFTPTKQQQQQPTTGTPLTLSPYSPYASRQAANDTEQHHHETTKASRSTATTVTATDSSSSHVRTTLSHPYMEDSAHVPENVHVLHRLAMEHVHNGEYDMALMAFMRVLQLQIKAHGPVHPTVASAHHNLGTVHAKRASVLLPDSAQQRHCRAQALACFQSAARTARDSLGRNHPNVAVSLVRIGFLLLQARQYQNAIVTFQEALRIRLAHYGAHHGLVANLYNNLGVCHMHLGNFEKGREFLEAALDIQRRVQGDSVIGRLELADTLFNIGGLCLEWIRRQGPDARRAIDAEEAFAEALDIRMKVLGPEDQMVLQVKALLDMARAVPRPKITSSSSLVSYRTVPKTPPSAQKNGSNPPAVQRRGMAPTTARSSTASRPYDEGRNNSLRASRPYDERNGSLATSRPLDARNNNLLDTASRASAASSPFDERAQRLGEAAPESSIFRAAPSTPRRYEGSSSAARPPMMQVSVSRDEDDEDENDRNDGRGTRIYVSPHLVPESPKAVNLSEEALAHRSYESSFTQDVSSENALASSGGNAHAVQKAYSYDAEENCLLSESGVDSDFGKIHFPLSWNKAGLEASRGTGMPSRDIMVTRPYRGTPRAITENDRDVGIMASNSSDRWGSETVNFSTGNKERDDIMNRARAILDIHERNPELLENSPGRKTSRTSVNEDEEGPMPARKKPLIEQDLLEDGVAPLGGDWPRNKSLMPLTLREMLKDPMNNLHDIHDEAARKLNENDPIDALALFTTVLQCQRRRQGHLHPDVASALHNVGIAQLRSQNHLEALKAFEEAARIRKGCLGREHPQVAESLVKVGITLLLMHRFEDALWSFREALSVRKHAMGNLHPSTARIYNNIGCVHVEFNEYREARRAFEAALDIQRNALAHDPDSGPLMFGTATTLCNLGYLYRYRDLHAKATLVLKEALDLQESVLGRSHPTVLSTLDNLADSCANSGHAVDALKYYNMVLERFRVGGKVSSKKILRAEAVLLYKMSRVHRQRNDLETQLDKLKLALRSIRAFSDAVGGGRTDTLERRILYDIRECREQLEKDEMQWI